MGCGIESSFPNLANMASFHVIYYIIRNVERPGLARYNESSDNIGEDWGCRGR